MRRLLNWLRRTNLEADLERELRYHIDRRVSDLMQTGLDESEARRRATLELGGLARLKRCRSCHFVRSTTRSTAR